MQIKCTLFEYIMKTQCRLNAYFACIRVANLAHTHLLVVNPERPAVDKLLSKEILVPTVKMAEDLNLRQVVAASAALEPRSMFHAQHPPPNLTCRELVVPSV